MTIIYAGIIIAALTLWIPLFIFGAVVSTFAYFTYSSFKSISSHKTVDFKPEQYQGETGRIDDWING